MNGPPCPVHGTDMDWLSTINEWEYYCKTCDVRYNQNMKRMDESVNWKPKEGEQMNVNTVPQYRLVCDLTRYHPEFVAGAVGTEARQGRRGSWARGSDRFFPLELKSGEVLDVLWSSVERVKEEQK